MAEALKKGEKMSKNNKKGQNKGFRRKNLLFIFLETSKKYFLEVSYQ